MGIILPKWKSQKSSKETLEAIENNLQSLIKRRAETQQCERSFAGSLIVAFVLLYPILIVVGVVLWVWFSHVLTLQVATVYLVLMALLPIMFYGFKKLIGLYFIRYKSQYDMALETLQLEKKRVLDEVMEKEPYKVACELLEKYEPSHSSLRRFNSNDTNVRRRTAKAPPPPAKAPPIAPSNPHPVLQQRPQPVPSPPPQPFLPPTQFSVPPPQPSLPPTQSSLPPPQPSLPPTQPSLPPTQEANVRRVSTEMIGAHIPPGHCFGAAPGPPVPVPILPRDRSNVDRVVEYLLGDGPNNRFALICSECCSHNGMALKDDFEYLTFRCAYCYHLNPARKAKTVVDLPARATPIAKAPPPTSERDRTVDTADSEPLPVIPDGGEQEINDKTD